jgi:hypothetical protein
MSSNPYQNPGVTALPPESPERTIERSLSGGFLALVAHEILLSFIVGVVGFMGPEMLDGVDITSIEVPLALYKVGTGFLLLRYYGRALGGAHHTLLLGTGAAYVLLLLAGLAGLIPESLAAALTYVDVVFRLLFMAVVVLLSTRHLNQIWTWVATLGFAAQAGMQVYVPGLTQRQLEAGMGADQTEALTQAALGIALVQLTSSVLIWASAGRLALLRRWPVKGRDLSA